MKNAFRYLSQHCSATPKNVDRLIISAFLTINELQPCRNKFLNAYSISESDKDEYSKLTKFITVINGETEQFGFEELIELFEFVISPADRIINGAIYTPRNIREYIVNETFAKINQKSKYTKQI